MLQVVPQVLIAMRRTGAMLPVWVLLWYMTGFKNHSARSAVASTGEVSSGLFNSWWRAQGPGRGTAAGDDAGNAVGADFLSGAEDGC